ncbi:kinase/pyrophosphorylase [Microbacterium sp. HMH0099]|uniref:kinase/pyrophosphorylase n=1 Tax=Microbacterium sp. HMH0099 TaxID=3414026 RepID=UPI003BF8B661
MSHGLTFNVVWWAERGSQGAAPSVPRTVFFVSDSTGITAETLGNALLADFPSARLERHTVPFFSSNATADAVVARLRRAAAAGYAPIVLPR